MCYSCNTVCVYFYVLVLSLQKKILNNKGICKEFDKELLILRVKSQFELGDIYYVSNLKENSFTLSYLLYDEMIVENFVRVGKITQ